MNPFAYRRAEDADGTVATVSGNPNAAYLGAGTNLVDHLKLEGTAPELLVGVSGLPLDRIDPLPSGGLRIGATVGGREVQQSGRHDTGVISEQTPVQRGHTGAAQHHQPFTARLHGRHRRPATRVRRC
ncbi:FAD binding domain-containing protein [Amycolatopsis anabasis]|uniref:FAD binding domain-containing protein n=1 Tax=Amycolatopsis anabasis TaxID=1840409 RepID=UPI00131E131C|nr:FAD binding domain-containing protein [Amycolatopsis anabasis]